MNNKLSILSMGNLSGKNIFDPSGIGVNNGNFIGLPFTEETANVVLLPVPWDVTVSFGEGTALAPQIILDSSFQLDLFDPDVEDAWKQGVFFLPVNDGILEKRNQIRPLAITNIEFMERGGGVVQNKEMQNLVKKINAECESLNNFVYTESKKLLESGKMVGLVGGDHSTPLGYLQALSEKYAGFGVLQIDAHHDLRDSYEGFTFSHASIFFNALKIKNISKLVQVGIRDYCEEEAGKVKQEGERVSVFYDHHLKENQFTGLYWSLQCEKIIKELPEKVYISFDIDGLDPKLCPNTGTPVPGGMELTETLFLLKKLVESGRKIIGFDLCEVGKAEWDANVGARILYKLCNLMGRSNGLI